MDTHSDYDGDLCEDTLPSVPSGIHLGGGYLHDEGSIHSLLTLPVEQVEDNEDDGRAGEEAGGGQQADQQPHVRPGGPLVPQ